MSGRAILLLLASVVCAGCWDFVEPDFPEAGAPAVLSATVFASEQGTGQINGFLAPGLQAGGLQRNVPNDTLVIYGLKLVPVEVRKNGTRVYFYNGDIPSTLGAFEVQAPRVEGLAELPPIRWFPIRKIGPDTLVWRPGSDLVLQVDTVLAPSTPVPQIRQWFLELRGRDRSFRVSSDGFPPPNLRVPAEWMPQPENGIIIATLTFLQSGQQQSLPRDYLGNVAFTINFRWVLKVAAT